MQIFAKKKPGWDPTTAGQPNKFGKRHNTNGMTHAGMTRRLVTVAPMAIAQEDFHGDVDLWRRAARQLVNQLYRAKFVLGNLVEGVDDLHEKDKAGELHTDEVPVDDIINLAHAPQDKEELEGKLKKAEAIIRKLYARSMALTQENAALRDENQQLREASKAAAARPRTASPSEGGGRLSRPRTSSSTTTARSLRQPDGSVREGDSKALTHRDGAHEKEERKAGGKQEEEEGCSLGQGGGDDALKYARTARGVQDSAAEWQGTGRDVRGGDPSHGRSTSVPPEFLKEGIGQDVTSRGKGRGGREAGGGVGGSAMYDELKALQDELKASQRREQALQQALDNHKRLELLLWESKHMKVPKP